MEYGEALECGGLPPLWGGKGAWVRRRGVGSMVPPPPPSHPKAAASCRTPKPWLTRISCSINGIGSAVENLMDYAVIKTGGKQYRVSPGDVLEVKKLEGDPGTELAFTEVLMTEPGGAVQVGSPTVVGARVVAQVVKQGRAKKILVFKKKRRKNYR